MEHSYRPTSHPSGVRSSGGRSSRYFCRFTFGQFFTLIVLQVFTLFFIFYLGARYGRSLLGLPDSLPVVATAAESGLRIETTNPNVVAAVQDPEIKAMAEDLVKAAPTPDLKQRVTELLQKSYDEKVNEEKPLTGQKEILSPKVAPPVIPTPAPKQVAIPIPKPVSKPVSTAVIQTNPFKAKYSIQVGSYGNLDEAHEMVGHWKGKGYPAFLVSADLPGKGRWYRVRMGGFDDKNAAANYMNQFKSREKVEAFVAPNQ